MTTTTSTHRLQLRRTMHSCSELRQKLSQHVYLAPFPRYITLNNGLPLKSGLGIIQSH